MSERNPGLGFVWARVAIAEERIYRANNMFKDRLASDEWAALFYARRRLSGEVGLSNQCHVDGEQWERAE